MKKSFKLLLLIGLATSIGFTSCSKDDNEPAPKPAITIASPSEGATVTSGDLIHLEFTASANEKLKTVIIKRKMGGVEATVLDTTFSSSTTSSTFDKHFIAGSAGTEIFTITVTDKKDNVDTKTVSVNVVAAGTITSYTAKLLGGQENQTEGSFFSTTTGTIYNQANAKANAASVDFLYFYGATNQATISSPADADAAIMYNNVTTGLQTWTVKNATMFTGKLTNVDFDNATHASIAAAVVNPTASKVNTLAVGNVFGFKTVGGKSGLIKVTAVTGTQAGSITVSVKVQD